MLIMENAEEILQMLELFTRLKQKEIPRELEDYLCFVAKTGDTIFQWSAVKLLFREKLISVIKQFHEQTSDLPQYPNVDPFNYETMKAALLERLDGFSAAPFTIQRISELLTLPRKQYTRIDKFMRAIEKNILVVSTVEPGRKSVHDSSDYSDSLDSMVNGSNVVGSGGLSDDLGADIDVDIEMTDNNSTTTALPPINTLNSSIISNHQTQNSALLDPLGSDPDRNEDDLEDELDVKGDEKSDDQILIRFGADSEKTSSPKKRPEEDSGDQENATKKCKLDDDKAEEEVTEVVVKVDPLVVEAVTRTDDPPEPPLSETEVESVKESEESNEEVEVKPPIISTEEEGVKEESKEAPPTNLDKTDEVEIKQDKDEIKTEETIITKVEKEEESETEKEDIKLELREQTEAKDMEAIENPETNESSTPTEVAKASEESATEQQKKDEKEIEVAVSLKEDEIPEKPKEVPVLEEDLSLAKSVESELATEGVEVSMEQGEDSLPQTEIITDKAEMDAKEVVGDTGSSGNGLKMLIDEEASEMEVDQDQAGTISPPSAEPMDHL